MASCPRSTVAEFPLLTFSVRCHAKNTQNTLPDWCGCGHSADVPRGSSQHDLDVLTFTMFTPSAATLETHVITAAEYLET